MNEKWYKKIWDRLKSVKHIEIYIAVIFAIIILLIYFSTFGKSTGDTKTNINPSTMTSAEYAEFLEDKLSSVLSEVKGAGNVKVMVTLSSGSWYEYATNDETKTTTNGDQSITTTTKTPIIVTQGGENNLIVVKEYYPTVGGVVVISQGANDVTVKLELLKAVQTLLDVPTTNIEILVGSK